VIAHRFHCKLVLTYSQEARHFSGEAEHATRREGGVGRGCWLRRRLVQVVSFCSGWEEEWVCLVIWFTSIAGAGTGLDGSGARLQGSRAGAGDRGPGRAKSFGEKRILF
jgi:hypothetical protein